MRRGAVLFSTSRTENSSIAEIDHAVGLGDADALDEIAHRLRRHAAAAQPGERRHARIVPAVDVSSRHQLVQHALRQHRVGQIEPRELVLVRPRRHRQILDEPVVERPVILEFERADRMRDALDRVRLAVRVVVARVDAPFRAGARMRRMQDAIEHRVAQVDVARRHVDLGAQHARAVRELARAHAAEQVEIFLHACGRGTGCSCPARSVCRASARISSWRLVVDIGLAGPDQLLRPVVQLLEIVRRVIEVLAPVEAEPAHVAPRSRRCTPALPWSDWCRRSAGGSGRRTPARCRNSGRSTWRGRYADSRSAPAESASPRSCAGLARDPPRRCRG